MQFVIHTFKIRFLPFTEINVALSVQIKCLMIFEDFNLGNPLNNALEDLGFIYPTPIQKQSFQLVLSGRDMIGIAQTGTGKTLAYLLPIIKNLKYSKSLNPKALIIVPTRELVIQVVAEVEKLIKYMNIKVLGAYGGTNIKVQKNKIMEGIDILVATPGRLVDLTLSRALRLKEVRKFVIDEVDEMFHLGFRSQLTNVLDLLPSNRQNLLFSATMTDEVEELIGTFFRNPIKVEVDLTGTPVEKIKQLYYPVPNFYTKINLLKHLLATDKSMTRVLVFVGKKRLADIVHENLEEVFGDEMGIIHSNKSQNYRNRNIEDFHSGKTRALIATDIIARGLDISEVSHVVNIDLPDVPINYMHRIGRTGRADKEGIALSFRAEYEVESLMGIEDLMKMQVQELPFPQGVTVSDQQIPEEIPRKAGDKPYYKEVTIKASGGAYHEKKAKNLKVNRAQERRDARKLEKKNAKRRPKRK